MTIRRTIGLALALTVTATITTSCDPSDPAGSLDDAAGGLETITVRGWAVDPDQPTESVAVHVYVDGNGVAALTANQNRPDVAAAKPGYGAAHGFSGTFSVAAGSHEVCTFAINVGKGATNTQLGCKRVTVTDNSPFGNVEVANVDPVGIRLAGWVVDPDSSVPTDLVVTLNGAQALVVPANGNRPDVAAAFPGRRVEPWFSTSTS